MLCWFFVLCILIGAAVDASPSPTHSPTFTVDPNKELFAVVGYDACAESLYYGPSSLSESGNSEGMAYYFSTSTSQGASAHQRWLQIVTSDGSTEMFRIYWTFTTAKTLADRFISAVAGGETVSYRVVDTSGAAGTVGAEYEYDGVWWFSNSAYITNSKFNVTATTFGFSADDGAWGAGPGTVQANGVLIISNFWGIANFDSVDSGCSRIYVQGSVKTSSTFTKSFLYVYSESEQPTKAPSLYPTIMPTKAPTKSPSLLPTLAPVYLLFQLPTVAPTFAAPSLYPTVIPTKAPSLCPTVMPTKAPTKSPSLHPTLAPASLLISKVPSQSPTLRPTFRPTSRLPTVAPTFAPSQQVYPVIVVQSTLTLTNVNIGSGGLRTQERELLINVSASILHFTTEQEKDSISISFVSALTKNHHPEREQKQNFQGEQVQLRGLSQLQVQEVVVTMSITMNLANYPSYGSNVSLAYSAVTNPLSQTSAFTQELRGQATANNVASFSTASVTSVASSLSSVQYPPTRSPTNKPGLNEKIEAFFTPEVTLLFVLFFGVIVLFSSSGIYVCLCYAEEDDKANDKKKNVRRGGTNRARSRHVNSARKKEPITISLDIEMAPSGAPTTKPAERARPMQHVGFKGDKLPAELEQVTCDAILSVEHENHMDHMAVEAPTMGEGGLPLVGLEQAESDATASIGPEDQVTASATAVASVIEGDQSSAEIPPSPEEHGSDHMAVEVTAMEGSDLPPEGLVQVEGDETA